MHGVCVGMTSRMLPAELLADLGHARPQLSSQMVCTFVMRQDRKHALECFELGLGRAGCAECALGREVIRRQVSGHDRSALEGCHGLHDSLFSGGEGMGHGRTPTLPSAGTPYTSKTCVDGTPCSFRSGTTCTIETRHCAIR